MAKIEWEIEGEENEIKHQREQSVSGESKKDGIRIAPLGLKY